MNIRSPYLVGGTASPTTPPKTARPTLRLNQAAA